MSKFAHEDLLIVYFADIAACFHSDIEEASSAHCRTVGFFHGIGEEVDDAGSTIPCLYLMPFLYDNREDETGFIAIPLGAIKRVARLIEDPGSPSSIN